MRGRLPLLQAGVFWKLLGAVCSPGLGLGCGEGGFTVGAVRGLPRETLRMSSLEPKLELLCQEGSQVKKQEVKKNSLSTRTECGPRGTKLQNVRVIVLYSIWAKETTFRMKEREGGREKEGRKWGGAGRHQVTEFV